MTSGGLTTMKSLRILSLIAVALLLAPVLAAADFGVRAGRYHDGDEEFVGAEAVYDIGAIKINPNIEYSLADDITAGSANLDVTFDVAHIGNITPYVGAGVGMSYVDDDLSTRTDIVGNVIGGVAFNFQFLKPYAQVKYFRNLDNEAGDGDDIALTVGLRF
jgi:opacity protein-like surface antigen